jgi:DNA-directed RNA polymerase subunit RPC12/RpoP
MKASMSYICAVCDKPTREVETEEDDNYCKGHTIKERRERLNKKKQSFIN